MIVNDFEVKDFPVLQEHPVWSLFKMYHMELPFPYFWSYISFLGDSGNWPIELKLVNYFDHSYIFNPKYSFKLTENVSIWSLLVQIVCFFIYDAKNKKL